MDEPKPIPTISLTVEEPKKHKPINVPPTILENDDDDTQHQRKESVRSHLSIKSLTSRNSSFKTNKTLNNNGYENDNYIGPLPSFGSTMSLKSTSSGQTIRESYCCWPDGTWNPRERKLIALVAVLASIILILVIVVGFIAGEKGIDQTFQWKW